MRKTLLCALVALTIFPFITVKGQTYSSLWKQANEAAEKDLPQTEREVVRKIALKAEKEKAYGQLLKAELKEAQLITNISPDSLSPAVERMKKREQQTKEVPLRAIYATVLGRIYRDNNNLDDHWKTIANDYWQEAVAQPQPLASVKATDYEPFVEKGSDSHYYGNDLLSVICYETQQFEVLHRYYLTTQNREAQLLSALSWLNGQSLSRKVYTQRIDSLINLYGDLTVCGEAAILKYERGEIEVQGEETSNGARIAFIDEALRRWGKWKRINVLRNYRNELTNPKFLAVANESLTIPNHQQTVYLKRLRGINTLTMNVYQVNADGDKKMSVDTPNGYKKVKPLLKPLPELTQKRTYTGKKEYEEYDDSLLLEGLPVGIYMLEFKSNPETEVSRSLYYVSNLRVLAEYLPEHRIRYAVVNATTGQPVAGAQVRITPYSTSKKAITLTTAKNGECLYQNDGNRQGQVYVSTSTDRSCPEMGLYGSFYYYEDKGTYHRAAVYTDRAIYRPGQKVQAAAIFYTNKNGIENEAQAGEHVTATLYDVNYKVVEEKELTTDAFGTAATDFILPKNSLTGLYRVKFNNTSRTFRVEEYKRPTFQVDIPDVTQDYKAGDTLTVQATAKSYAGVPVQGAKVHYTVERRRAFWWFSYRYYWLNDIDEGDNQVMEGEALTDADGHFEVKMPLTLPESQYPLFYNFVVVADVTDAAGETHQGQLSLPLGNRKTAITADLPEKILKEDMPQLKLHVLNAAGRDIPTTLRYQIDEGKWITVDSNTPVDLPKLKSGKHTLKAEYEGEKLEQEFVVFSLDDKSPVVETKDWFYISAYQFADATSPVTVQVGSSDKNLHIFYSLVAGKKIIEQGAIDRSGNLINRKLTYQDEYGDGLALNFAWVRDGKVYTHSATIKRPLPDKELRMKWETFRDRLTPGQQEEWTLTIADAEGKPVAAQLMATLYDKSLDQIMAHDWQLSPSLHLALPRMQWGYGDLGELHNGGSCAINYLPFEALAFSHFDDSLFPDMSYAHYLRRAAGIRVRGLSKTMRLGTAQVEMEEAMPAVMSAAKVANDSYQLADNAKESDEALSGTIGGLTIQGTKSAEDAEPQVEIRQNLQETAFFYPQLMADSTGHVSLKFTLPESLTTWRFLGIAHTKDLMHGFLGGEAVAQKEVMIQPNLPRFIRTGDKATISARIFNTSEKQLAATVRLVLSDPESNSVVYSQQTTETLPANQSIATTFSVDGSQLSQYALLVCKMTVEGESFSDGEQQYLPILSNEERVTVTVPFTQNEPGTQTIDLSKLLPSKAQDSKLTIEYTNNPAWLMIQSLPTVAQPCDKSAVSQAAAFYANGLGKYLIDKNPQVRQVFEAWQRESDASRSTLHSSLQQNEELKDLLLNETPWVMDAERETDQMNRLGDFFDENLMQQRSSSAVDQLKLLQNGDGSWSWYPGMRGSLCITIAVSEMLVRLNKMTSQQEATAQMLTQAFRFMDHEMVKIVNEMKKEERKGHQQTFPGRHALEYLYLSTLDGRQPDAKTKEAQNYLKNLLKKQIRNQSIYDKALSAIILNSTTYIKSLKEYTVYSEEMGRYYDTSRAGYSWRDYRIPTQVAAIEALQRLTPQDTKTIDEMRRWLLQEKRTQAWDTPINSANAIYAFLNEEGKSEKLASAEPTTLKIDGQPLSTGKTTAGLGYVKTALPVSATEKPKTFTAEKSSKGTSWGAVYAQFMQPTSEIQAQSSGISVKREIFYAGANSSLFT